MLGSSARTVDCDAIVTCLCYAPRQDITHETPQLGINWGYQLHYTNGRIAANTEPRGCTLAPDSCLKGAERHGHQHPHPDLPGLSPAVRCGGTEGRDDTHAGRRPYG